MLDADVSAATEHARLLIFWSAFLCINKTPFHVNKNTVSLTHYRYEAMLDADVPAATEHARLMIFWSVFHLLTHLRRAGGRAAQRAVSRVFVSCLFPLSMKKHVCFLVSHGFVLLKLCVIFDTHAYLIFTLTPRITLLS
jgi:hypothetical protein